MTIFTSDLVRSTVIYSFLFVKFWTKNTILKCLTFRLFSSHESNPQRWHWVVNRVWWWQRCRPVPSPWRRENMRPPRKTRKLRRCRKHVVIITVAFILSLSGVRSVNDATTQQKISHCFHTNSKIRNVLTHWRHILSLKNVKVCERF